MLIILLMGERRREESSSPRDSFGKSGFGEGERRLPPGTGTLGGRGGGERKRWSVSNKL